MPSFVGIDASSEVVQFLRVNNAGLLSSLTPREANLAVAMGQFSKAQLAPVQSALNKHNTDMQELISNMKLDREARELKDERKRRERAAALPPSFPQALLPYGTQGFTDRLTPGVVIPPDCGGALYPGFGLAAHLPSPYFPNGVPPAAGALAAAPPPPSPAAAATPRQRSAAPSPPTAAKSRSPAVSTAPGQIQVVALAGSSQTRLSVKPTPAPDPAPETVSGPTCFQAATRPPASADDDIPPMWAEALETAWASPNPAQAIYGASGATRPACTALRVTGPSALLVNTDGHAWGFRWCRAAASQFYDVRKEMERTASAAQKELLKIMAEELELLAGSEFAYRAQVGTPTSLAEALMEQAAREAAGLPFIPASGFVVDSVIRFDSAPLSPPPANYAAMKEILYERGQALVKSAVRTAIKQTATVDITEVESVSGKPVLSEQETTPQAATPVCSNPADSSPTAQTATETATPSARSVGSPRSETPRPETPLKKRPKSRAVNREVADLLASVPAGPSSRRSTRAASRDSSRQTSPEPAEKSVRPLDA